MQIGYEVRSSPLHRSIMQHIAAGNLGEITSVWWNQHTDQGKAAYSGWRTDRANMGGALFDCSVHYLDIISQWAGAPLSRLVALGNRLGCTGPCPSDELPESAAVALEYVNGVRGTFNFGGRNSFNDDAIFGVAGTSGCIRGNPIGAGHYELRTHGGICVSDVRFDPALTSVGHLGFAEQWEFFLDSVFEGAPLVCSLDDGVRVHRMMRAIDRSLGTGEVIVF
jgi:predicted dehydrogenase